MSHQSLSHLFFESFEDGLIAFEDALLSVHFNLSLLKKKHASDHAVFLDSRFDNSGHRIPFPGWHSNSTNVQRTDAIIKQIASMFATNTNVVSIIAPLNE